MAGKWGDNSLMWLLSVDIIATTPSDNIFVNNSGDGVKGLPICRHKWGQMAKNSIFWQMAGKWGVSSLKLLSLYRYHCNSS